MTEWDKDKQKADQLMADVDKLAQEKDQIKSQAEQFKTQFEVASERNEDLSAQLESTQAKIKELENSMRVEKSAEIKLPEIDAENAEVGDILAQNKALMQHLQSANKRIEQLAIIAEDYQQSKQQQEAEVAKNEAQEAVLKQLDNEYGAKFRNDAYKLATKWVEDGKESMPNDRLSAYLLCKKAYQEVSKEPDKPQTPIPSDTGRDSIPVSMDDNIGEGSLDEVLSKLKKSGKYSGAVLPD